jgi:hypothetical protein
MLVTEESAMGSDKDDENEERDFMGGSEDM